jgi:hypothetical protein
MFDPELPFHVIVKEKLAAAGLGDQLPALIQKATKTKHELNQIKKIEGPIVDESTADGDDDQAQQLSAGELNLEDIVGWPKDLIRSRRVEILMEMLTSPSSKVANLLQYFGDGNKRKSEMDDFSSHNELLAGMSFGQKVKRMRLDQGDESGEELSLEEDMAIRNSLKTLKAAIKLIKMNRFGFGQTSSCIVCSLYNKTPIAKQFDFLSTMLPSDFLYFFFKSWICFNQANDLSKSFK